MVASECICYYAAMRSFLTQALWWMLLAIVALRPWVLDFVVPEVAFFVQWFGLAFGLAWWLKQRGWRRPLPSVILYPCLLLVLAYLQGMMLSRNRLEAVLIGEGLAFGIVLCAAIAVADKSQRQRLQTVLVITGTLLALRGLWQGRVLLPAYDHLGSTPTALMAAIPNFSSEIVSSGRIFGPFPLPTMMASAMIILLPISVAVLHPWATTLKRRAITFSVWGVQATALLMTQSLGGILSLCAATLIVMLLRRSVWRQQAILVWITMLSMLLLLSLRPEITNLDHHNNPVMQRWRYWQSTVEMIRAHPVRGIGSGMYGSVYSDYRHPKATPTRFAHNAWLQVWVEWGVLGLIGLAGLFIGSLRLARGQPQGFQVALLAFWMVASIDITWSVLQVSCLWWILLGLMTPLSASTNITSHARLKTRGRRQHRRR